MATLLVQDIDESLLERIHSSAVAHQRSVDGEVKAVLEQVFEQKPFDRDAWMAKARQLRSLVRPDPKGISLAQSIADMREEQAERG